MADKESIILNAMSLGDRRTFLSKWIHVSDAERACQDTQRFEELAEISTQTGCDLK
jgi:hypothetical protein